jgi:hypothetical protein
MNKFFKLWTLAVFGAAVLAGAVELQPVESSWLDKAGYDAETQTLTIRMKNSSDIYEYQGVPEEVYRDFLAAESKGAFFAAHIQDAYPTVRR